MNELLSYIIILLFLLLKMFKKEGSSVVAGLQGALHLNPKYSR